MLHTVAPQNTCADRRWRPWRPWRRWRPWKLQWKRWRRWRRLTRMLLSWRRPWKQWRQWNDCFRHRFWSSLCCLWCTREFCRSLGPARGCIVKHLDFKSLVCLRKKSCCLARFASRSWVHQYNKTRQIGLVGIRKPSWCLCFHVFSFHVSLIWTNSSHLIWSVSSYYSPVFFTFFFASQWRAIDLSTYQVPQVSQSHDVRHVPACPEVHETISEAVAKIGTMGFGLVSRGGVIDPIDSKRLVLPCFLEHCFQIQTSCNDYSNDWLFHWCRECFHVVSCCLMIVSWLFPCCLMLVSC